MKIAICDDDKYFANDLKERIKKYDIQDPISNQLDCYTDPQLFIRNFSDQLYDLIFLDIEFHQTNGIKIAKEIHEIKRDCLIIFVTCHNNYVMDSYHVDALQYIEKPFSDNILFSELKRAIKIYKTLNHTVQFQTFEGHKLVKTSDIIYLETSYDRYKVILTNSKNHYGSYRNVKKVRQYLLDHYFFKLNRSTTINLSHVETYTCNSITMSNHDILPLTKSKKKEFLKCYYDFMDKDDEDNK